MQMTMFRLWMGMRRKVVSDVFDDEIDLNMVNGL